MQSFLDDVPPEVRHLYMSNGYIQRNRRYRKLSDLQDVRMTNGEANPAEWKYHRAATAGSGTAGARNRVSRL